MRPFVKGQSGNPGGRPRVEKKIREKWNACAVKDGYESGVDEFVQFCREVISDKSAKLRDRIIAMKLLKEAGLGLPRQLIELEGNVRTGDIDWGNLSDDDLDKMITEGMRGDGDEQVH